MGINDFRIVFDNSSNTYYPGQNVSGNVIVRIDKPKKVRSIHVKIKGAADTCWAIDKEVLNNEGRYEDKTETVTGYEEYFKTQYYLYGSASGSELILPVGEHVYPFTFILPFNLPSSFESDFGQIRYTIKAVLDRPWKFDQEAIALFTVVSPLDLNQESGASESINKEMSKTFCCCCCASLPVNINVSLPVQGYVPGQDIPIKINVENMSGVDIVRIKLKFKKCIKCYANNPTSETKEETKVISKVSKGPIGPNDEYEEKLNVPPLPPSNLKNCGIIDLSYRLQLEVCMSGWYRRNLVDSFDLIIGTIPLSGYQQPIPMLQEAETVKPGEIGFVMPPSAPPMEPSMNNLYPNLPAPSYAESMFNARSLREKGESDQVFGLDNRFAPRYPVYNFGPLQ